MILNRASPFIQIDAERRSGTFINRLLETLFPALFHTASTLSAPSGHLPLEGKADDTRIPSSNMRRSRHHKFESRDEWFRVAGDYLPPSGIACFILRRSRCLPP